MNLGVFDCANGVINLIVQDGDLVVRNATYKDSSYIDKLQKESAYAVGFIQKTIWDKYVFGGERNFFVLMCEANNQPVGYALVTPGHKGGDFVRIQQIAVQSDARRLHYGSMLIGAIKRFCNEHSRIGARLRCRRDLESNLFWAALGFQQYGTWEKGKVNHVGFKASNDICLWEIMLSDSILTFPFLFNSTAGN